MFYGDIAFYSGDWGRTGVASVDTKSCPLAMLAGDYDYSCTVEMSEAISAIVPGVTFRAMPGIGLFPFAENPRLFAEYLFPASAAFRS